MERASLFVILTCWLRPATTAPKLAGIKLRWAWAIHLLAVAASAVIAIILTNATVHAHRQDVDIVATIFAGFGRFPARFAILTIMITVAVELGFLALAIIVLPWGAGDEPLRSSWAHALRHTWLHTTHFLLLVLLIGLLIWRLEAAHERHYAIPPYPQFQIPSYPEAPWNAPADAPAWVKYNESMHEYARQTKEMSDRWKKALEKRDQAMVVFIRRAAEIFEICVSSALAGTIWVLGRCFGRRGRGELWPRSSARRPASPAGTT